MLRYRHLPVHHPQERIPLLAQMFTVAILTISDAVSLGKREDTSGDNIESALELMDMTLRHRDVVPDDRLRIAGTLKKWSDQDIDLILTTGGTGLGPRDVTPEATRDVVTQEVPGLAEVMRLESWRNNQHAILSRAVVGIRGKTLIINLPGSPKSVAENLAVVMPVVPHAIAILKGEGADHTPPSHDAHGHLHKG